MNEKEIRNIILYSSPDGSVKLEVPIDGETVWLTTQQMADLFGIDRSGIVKHTQNVIETNELDKSTCAKIAQVTKDGKKRLVDQYNLDMIISVGYRVNSIRGTQFRIWATNKLKEYIVKGFVLDDERLAEGKKSRYFDELLERIRAIRASERNFYQKITDIYATSVDYNKDATQTKMFFATVQNKIHFAVHGHTAAEIVVARADAKKRCMGLTNFKGKIVLEKDISIAKNYLSEEELKQLNLIVTLYLDFAELQASNHRAMTMNEWVTKLDDFLKLSEKQILSGSGKVSKEKAEEKARREYEKYRMIEDMEYISDFDRHTKKYLDGKKSSRASILMIRDGKVLMIHRLRDGNEYYVLPGGGIEANETPEMAALRELEEETSVGAEIIKQMAHFSDSEGHQHYIFLSKYVTGTPNLKIDSPEKSKSSNDNVYEPQWVSIKKLKESVIWPEEVKKFIFETK